MHLHIDNIEITDTRLLRHAADFLNAIADQKQFHKVNETECDEAKQEHPDLKDNQCSPAFCCEEPMDLIIEDIEPFTPQKMAEKTILNLDANAPHNNSNQPQNGELLSEWKNKGENVHIPEQAKKRGRKRKATFGLVSENEHILNIPKNVSSTHDVKIPISDLNHPHHIKTFPELMSLITKSMAAGKISKETVFKLVKDFGVNEPRELEDKPGLINSVYTAVESIVQ